MISQKKKICVCNQKSQQIVYFQSDVFSPNFDANVILSIIKCHSIISTHSSSEALSKAKRKRQTFEISENTPNLAYDRLSFLVIW